MWSSKLTLQNGMNNIQIVLLSLRLRNHVLEYSHIKQATLLTQRGSYTTFHGGFWFRQRKIPTVFLLGLLANYNAPVFFPRLQYVFRSHGHLVQQDVAEKEFFSLLIYSLDLVVFRLSGFKRCTWGSYRHVPIKCTCMLSRYIIIIFLNEQCGCNYMNIRMDFTACFTSKFPPSRRIVLLCEFEK